MREGVGPDMPLIIRLSQWKLQDYAAKIAETPTEMAEWLLPLSEAGVDVFHCSQRRFWEPEFEGSDLNFAGWAKKITGKPTITVGSVGLDGEFIAAFGGAGSKPASLDGLIERMERDEFDLVAVGRALLADPELGDQGPRRPPGRTHDFDRGHMAVLHCYSSPIGGGGPRLRGGGASHRHRIRREPPPSLRCASSHLPRRGEE